MGERRSNRGLLPRTDRQIAEHDEDVWVLERVARGEVTMQPETRSALRRLAREDVLLAGFGQGSVASLLPRGRRILAVVHGEIVISDD